MDETNDLLTRQIAVEIEKLSTMEDGSDEKTATINGISQLYKVKIENERLTSDIEAQAIEQKETKKDRFIGYGLSVLKVGLPLAVYVGISLLGFKFEETGSINSQQGRSLMTKFNPFKM